MPNNTMTIETIVDETSLGDLTATHISESGDLCIIQDESVAESEQVYIHLSAQKVRALLKFLAQRNVASAYNTNQ